MDAGENRTSAEPGSVQRNISRRLVGLHKEFYGRGPKNAKTYYLDDAVLVLMRGGFSKVEETLLAEGRGHAVVKQRMEFQEVMRRRFTEVVEQEMRRDVIGFMSGTQQDPDLSAEIFVLAPRGDESPEDAPTAATSPAVARLADRVLMPSSTRS